MGKNPSDLFLLHHIIGFGRLAASIYFPVALSSPSFSNSIIRELEELNKELKAGRNGRAREIGDLSGGSNI